MSYAQPMINQPTASRNSRCHEKNCKFITLDAALTHHRRLMKNSKILQPAPPPNNPQTFARDSSALLITRELYISGRPPVACRLRINLVKLPQKSVRETRIDKLPRGFGTVYAPPPPALTRLASLFHAKIEFSRRSRRSSLSLSLCPRSLILRRCLN